MKFDMQYCQNNYLHELSWYVHTHDYSNMTWYELSMLQTSNLIHDFKKNFLNINTESFKESFLRILL